MIKFISRIIAGAALLCAPAIVSAAEPGQVTLQGDVKLEKTVTAEGITKTVLEVPKVVVPGDRLLFSTRYENHGAALVKNLVVTNPVPSAVSVNDESVNALQVSVDGGTTFGALGSLKVNDAGATRAAAPTDITHIRWTIAAIPPGGSGAVGYHGIVR